MFCISCGKEIPDSASFCPFCGKTTVAPVHLKAEAKEKKSVLTPASRARPNRSRLRLIAGVLGGLCLLLILFLLIDPFKLHLIGRLTGSYDAALTAMPPDTNLYVGVDLLAVDWDKLNRIATAFEKAAGNADVEGFEEEFNKALEQVLDVLEITLDENIVPWVGQYLGVGTSNANLSNYQDIESGDTDLMIAIEARNRQAADEFLEKLVERMSDLADTRFYEMEYEGVRIYEFEDVENIERVAMARSANLVLFGYGIDVIEDAIDAQQGDSLADNKMYRDVVRKLPKRRALTTYFGTSIAEEMMADLKSELGMEIGDWPLFSLASIGISLSLVDVGLQVDFVTALDSSRLNEAQDDLMRSYGKNQLVH